MRAGLTILMYHRVLPRSDCADYPLESLVMPLEAFQQQVAWLSRSAEVVPVAEALERLAGGEASVKPLVSVTFDDGYADNFEHAAPVLESNGLRGTFFVATDFVGRGFPFWFDVAADAWTRLDYGARMRLLEDLSSSWGQDSRKAKCGADLASWMSALKLVPVTERDRCVEMARSRVEGEFDATRFRAMTREQLVELDRRGHEVASHGVSHSILPLLDDTALAHELRASRVALSDWLGHDVNGFCYPNGDSDPRVIAAARAAGYRYACSTIEGLNRPGEDAFRLKRRPIAMRRVFGPDGAHSLLGFRTENSGLRSTWR
ncbi:polysaccharide deacetylase family protein [Thioalkalivibrio sp. XN279]|uniref:polysaccharide deacetylase family protein n=1 Tax=Thioalkalivibrio sp. XN279 TaxID=2714953 RepID=UPI00140878C4|nr:polysaccharide deacetylase family protein [Thioalkalivibrio sp. XN279]NHA15378.1 polysaccharide deacetylase family protein [Thioalkalivibrio sp. XN279]